MLAALLTATGCHFSHVDPNADITVSGRALDASGKPLANTKVRLFKEADFGEAVIGIVFTLGTLGSVCLLPNAPTVCRRAKTATTDASGQFTFKLKGSDTQGLIGTESTLDLVVSNPGAGANDPSTTVTFTVKQASVSLPDARLWAAKPAVREGGDTVHLTWPALPASYGSSPKYAAQLYDPTRQAATWTQNASAGGADIDARILEDKAAAAAVQVRTELAGASGAGSVHGVYGSAKVAVRPIAGAPPSRGKPCLATTGFTSSPNSDAVPQAKCTVTDGDLIGVGNLTGKPNQTVTGVTVDLQAERPVHLVVVRGFGGMFDLEVSSDGQTFRQVGIGEGSTATVSPAGAPTARYVRVRSPSGLSQSLMCEVSIW